MHKYILFLFIFLFAKLSSQEQIPILGWYGILPNDTVVDHFKQMSDAGFTLNFSFYNNINEVEQALDAAQKANIKLLIACPELHTNTIETVSKLKDNPALAGYFLRDEPTVPMIADLGALAVKIKQYDKSHYCYSNLLPTYAPLKAIGADSYQDYVNIFIKEIPVSFLSFDFYPLLESNSKKYIREGWYNNLEIIRKASIDNKIPFWAFALVTAHDAYPSPTVEEVRLQVFTNLMYGAQGIEYFTYVTPEGDNGRFHGGPIDRGKKTAMYDIVKQVNSEIKAVSPVFLNCDVIDVFHYGKPVEGTNQFQKNKLPKNIQKFIIEGRSALISLIQKDNKKYLIIQNTDISSKMSILLKGKNIKLQFLEKGQLTKLNSSNNMIDIPTGNILICEYV